MQPWPRLSEKSGWIQSMICKFKINQTEMSVQICMPIASAVLDINRYIEWMDRKMSFSLVKLFLKMFHRILVVIQFVLKDLLS